MTDLTGINNEAIVAFKPKIIDDDPWYIGKIQFLYPPNSKYNKEDYWIFSIVTFVPTQLNVYYQDDVEKVVLLDNSII